MKQVFAALLFLALAGTLAVATPAQDRGDHQAPDDHHDNGKHNGQAKQQNSGDHHDNGQHNGQVKHEDAGNRHDNGEHNGQAMHNGAVQHHDYESARIHPGHPYPYGRYDHVKSVFVAHHFDARTRRIILGDNSNWVVASYDLPRCNGWDWDHDQVFVYDDDHHPGWYLLFNARLGAYVHVEFAGIH